MQECPLKPQAMLALDPNPQNLINLHLKKPRDSKAPQHTSPGQRHVFQNLQHLVLLRDFGLQGLGAFGFRGLLLQ